MNALLQQFIKPKNKLSLILLAGVVLFMQCYLLQHKVEHQHATHDTHETIHECQLCLGAQQTSELVLLDIHHLWLDIVRILIIVPPLGFVIFSPAFLLPHTRAPPQSFQINFIK
jgi:hypothetical protein